MQESKNGLLDIRVCLESLAACEDLEQVHRSNILKVTFFGTSCRFFTYKDKGGRQNDSLQNICLAGLNIQPN